MKKSVVWKWVALIVVVCVVKELFYYDTVSGTKHFKESKAAEETIELQVEPETAETETTVEPSVPEIIAKKVWDSIATGFKVTILSGNNSIVYEISDENIHVKMSDQVEYWIKDDIVYLNDNGCFYKYKSKDHELVTAEDCRDRIKEYLSCAWQSEKVDDCNYAFSVSDVRFGTLYSGVIQLNEDKSFDCIQLFGNEQSEAAIEKFSDKLPLPDEALTAEVVERDKLEEIWENMCFG